MSTISDNIRFLRRQEGLTQELFAVRIGIKRSLLGAYEEGRAEPGLHTLQTIAREFQVSVDLLIGQDLTQKGQFQEAIRQDIEGKKLRVLAITVDNQDREHIRLVPQKAAAGYLNGYSDPEYVAELPQFYLPIFSNGTYRAFEIKGDSMLPLQSGSIIIGQYLDNWKLLKNDKTFVVVTRSEGIVYKRIINQLTQKQNLLLISDNPAYDAYEVHAEEIMEVWEAKAFISTQFPEPISSVERLTSMVQDLQKEMGKLKGR